MESQTSNFTRSGGRFRGRPATRGPADRGGGLRRADCRRVSALRYSDEPLKDKPAAMHGRAKLEARR